MNFKRYRTQVPSEYQELTFIANSGTQYIDTGLKGSDLADCEFEIVMRNNVTSTTAYNFNGTYLSGSTAQFGLVATSSSECRASMNFGFADAISTTGLSLYEFHTLYATNGLQKVDNTVVGTLNFGTLNDGNFLLFAKTDPNQTSGVNICSAMGLKSFTIKRNNQYIRNMIPVRRKSDNQLGLYDTANDVFYTNQGTGDFTGGTVVEPTWVDSHYIMGTDTDTITTLPAVIYPNASSITVGIKGNTTQSGTPSPSNPVDVDGVGELETSGEHSGQFKIPILINGTTTNIYIGDNPLRKSLDGTAYDTLDADGTLTQRVDSDGSVLATPVVTQITMPTFTVTAGANTFDVDTTIHPSEVTATFEGWHPVSAAHERENGQWD